LSGIFASELMADAQTILKRHIYLFDEGERELKTSLVLWLGKETEEETDVHALTVAIPEAMKNGPMRHEARMPVLRVHVMESKDAEV
jgi:hypothetical protein